MNQITTDLPVRIKNIYSTCSEQEQTYLRNILQELADVGYSKTYEEIWLADYKEIPVDIWTFLSSDMYLGRATNNGKSIYPYWKKTLIEIFNAGNKYDEVIFTGATRIGKSSTAISAISYMLYRLMCLKDPQKFFGKKEVSKFSILFFNLTEKLAKGVAYREFNDTLKVSPWFNSHGSWSKSDRDFYYIPEGGKVVISYGSDSAHALGMQVFCVVGDTNVLTSDGYRRIDELSGKYCDLAQYNYSTSSIEYECSRVQLTGYADTTIRVELEDGTVIEGTPDHRIMLSDGTYKCLKDLKNSDDPLTFNNSEVIK